MTYNGKKTFFTFMGGLATILTFLLIFYWWGITLLNHLTWPYRRYTNVQFELLTTELNTTHPGQYPIYSFAPSDLLVVYQTVSLNDTIFPIKDTSVYIDAVYVQEYLDSTT